MSKQNVVVVLCVVEEQSEGETAGGGQTKLKTTPWRTTTTMPLLPGPTLFRTTDGHCVIHQQYPMDTSLDRIIDVTNLSGRPRRRCLLLLRQQQQRRDFTLPRLSTTLMVQRTWDTHTRVQLLMSLHDLHA